MRCPSLSSAANESAINFRQKLREIECQSIARVLTLSAFDGMVNQSCGYQNAGLHLFRDEKFYQGCNSFENKPYVIISTCILQIFLHGGILLSVHTVKISTPKIDKILKAEIKLSVLKFMYAGKIPGKIAFWI